jgi:predicted permease
MGELWRRIWYLLNRARFERELEAEMEAHRVMKGDAGPRFGNVLRLREEARDEWGWAWLDAAAQDLRFACRLLWRSPSFTLTAIGVLALGVGLNLAAYQIIDLVAVSWLPVRSPETLIKLHHRNPRGSGTSFSYPAFDFYRRHASTIRAPMALVYGGVTLDDDPSQPVNAEFVTGNYFSELGASPLAGRLLDHDDDTRTAPAVVVLSEGLWRSRLGSDPSVVGRRVRLNGQPFTVVGVTSRLFVGVGGEYASLWIPVTHHPIAFPGSTLLEDWNGAPVRFYARVPEGVAITAAAAELQPVVNALRALHPKSVAEGEALVARQAGRFLSLEEAGPALALNGALVALILVTACMNLGLLVLARTLSRGREFAIRLSVGATRRRIFRQLMTEHLLLGVLGAAVACFVAVESSHAVLSLIGAPPGLAPQFNARVIIVAVALAIVSSLMSGFAPAWQTLRPVTAPRLRLRSVLLGVQVAAATALLIVSSLLVRGVTRIVRVPLGFDYQQTLLADPGLASHGVTAAAAQEYWGVADARVRHIPGVRNAALTTLPPFGHRVTINRERTVFYHVTPSFFSTMQIAVKQGRIFSAAEAGVALVSESLARRRWADQGAIGQVYEGATIIGIVDDARTVRLNEQSATECYLPIAATHLPDAVMVVRADAPASAALPIRAAMRDAGARATPSIVLLQDAFAARLEKPRRVAKIATAVGICALLLAVTGLAGMVAFSISERLREIGVRLALGARPSHLVRAIARQFAVPVISGAAAGSALAVGVGTILSRELFGIGQMDPLSHGGALLIFAIVAAAAVAPSLRRALRVDPIATLRHE